MVFPGTNPCPVTSFQQTTKEKPMQTYPIYEAAALTWTTACQLVSYSFKCSTTRRKMQW